MAERRKLEDGFYIVEVDGERRIGELMGDTWFQLGIEYDIWQYTEKGQMKITVLARIYIEDLLIRLILPQPYIYEWS